VAVAVPHLHAPFTVIGKSAGVVEQGTRAEVDQCVVAVLKTPRGSRLEAPEFGVPDETFARQSPTPTADVYLAAIEEGEPRARVMGEATFDEMVEKIVIRPELASV
jgi:phage baseplate assembly protein W